MGAEQYFLCIQVSKRFSKSDNGRENIYKYGCTYFSFFYSIYWFDFICFFYLLNSIFIKIQDYWISRFVVKLRYWPLKCHTVYIRGLYMTKTATPDPMTNNAVTSHTAERNLGRVSSKFLLLATIPCSHVFTRCRHSNWPARSVGTSSIKGGKVRLGAIKPIFSVPLIFPIFDITKHGSILIIAFKFDKSDRS